MKTPTFARFSPYRLSESTIEGEGKKHKRMNITKSLTLALLISAPLTAWGQNGVNSPYSRYGFGLLSERSMGFNKAMGGVALGFRDGQEINIANPASYSAVDSLTSLFDLGFTVQNGNLQMGKLTQNARNSSFDYFAYSFRATEGLGITVALLPFSKINYSFSSDPQTVENNNSITNSYTYTGNGGLRQVMLGAGWKPFAPLSIGINIGYMWGDYEHNMTNTTSSSNAYSMKRAYTSSLSTYTLEAGIQYMANLSEKDKLTVGATYSLGHNMSGDAVRKTSTISSSTEASMDIALKNAFQLPHSFGLGVTYYKESKIRAGIDAGLERWSKVKFPTAENYEEFDRTNTWTPNKNVLNDRFKVSAGIEYTPDFLSSSFFKRLKYKFGGYYSTSYANANESANISLKKPYEFGITGGVTIPIRNRNLFYGSPKLNIALSWIHTNIPYSSNMTSSTETLKENYLRLSVGLTISERWFHKWKVQ